MTDKQREKFIKQTVVDTMSTTANHIITQDVYKKLTNQGKKINPLLKRIKRDIGQEEFKQHYQNLLKDYGKKDEFDDETKKSLTSFINQRINGKSGEALLKDFKDAFKLATKIRQIVTDEKITFSVVTEADNNKIKTIELSTNQMLKRLKLGSVAVDNMSSNILSAIKTVQTNVKQTSYLKKRRFSAQSNLYKSIVSFFETVTSYTGKDLNKGTRWQLYYYFYNKYDGNEDITLTDTEQLLRGYFISKAGYDWYTGGDVGNLQIKYEGASFTSFNSVVTILEKFKKVLDKSENMSESERTNAFRKLFQVDQQKQVDDVTNKLDQFLKDKSVEELDKMFKAELQKSMA